MNESIAVTKEAYAKKRFSSTRSDKNITRNKGALIPRRHRAGHIGGAAIEYTDGDILPALPETMTIRERRPSLMPSPIPGESWQVT